MNHRISLLVAGMVLLSACSEKPERQAAASILDQPREQAVRSEERAKIDRRKERLAKLAKTPDGWTFISQAHRECESLALAHAGGSHPSKFCRAVSEFVDEHRHVW